MPSHPIGGGPAAPVTPVVNGKAVMHSGTATDEWSTVCDANPDRRHGVLIQNTNSSLVELRIHPSDEPSPTTFFVLQPHAGTPITQDNNGMMWVLGNGAVQVTVSSGTCTYVAMEV